MARRYLRRHRTMVPGPTLETFQVLQERQARRESLVRGMVESGLQCNRETVKQIREWLDYLSDFDAAIAAAEKTAWVSRKRRKKGTKK